MKRFIITALKVLFLILLFVGAAVGSYALVTYKGWPWWAGACLFGGVIGIWAAGLFLRKWFLRRRERTFVKRIIDQDDSSIAAAPIHERQRLQELQDRWKNAIELLRGSNLRKRGNPLYVLPWYMVFGESDSGKSTAVASSRLTTILTDVGPVPGVAATKNCDWWFFEEAIILDTAGRYAIPIDESRDREEWERFLSLLLRYRKREPLNGLIVTLPADRLLSDSHDALTEYGKSIRRRVNELMRVLGARFPVYVLATKMDLVFGMTGLSEMLPEHVRSQAMGLVNEAMLSDPVEFVGKAVSSVQERLRELRLLLPQHATHVDPSFLLFSDELERLAPKIKAFAEGAFEDNPYQEAPMLRGLFFSSGLQTGELTSDFFSGLESLKNIKKRLPGTTCGLFLHDFFAKVLPRDRNLFTPILEFLKWKLLTRNLGMAAWLLLLFFVSGLFSLSYLGNVRAMNGLFNAFPHKPVFSDKIDEKIIEMDAFRERILELRRLNSGWWVPRMGLDVSLAAQEQVEAYYTHQFKTLALTPMDTALDRSISTLDTRSSEQVTSDFVELLAWRIDLIDKRLAGGTIQDLAGLPLPKGKALQEAVPGFSADLMDVFGQLYETYLVWTPDTETLSEQQTLLRSKLGTVLTLKGADFKWLVDWANQRNALHTVTLRDFWGGPQVPLGHDVYIPAAYTAKGREALHGFLAEMRGAMKDLNGFDIREKVFWEWYAQQYYSVWYTFAERFIEGEGQLLTKNEYREMAMRMSTADNPYFNLLVRMKEEFSGLKGIIEPPAWVTQVFNFNIVVAQYQASKAKGVEEALEKAESELRTTVVNLSGNKLASSIEARIESAKQLDYYMKVLQDTAAYTSTQENAFKSASALFVRSSGTDSAAASGAGAAQKNPVDEAIQAISMLKNSIGTKGHGEGMFWSIVAGPLDFLLYFITQEAACELQDLWEGQVLAEVAHIPPDKLRERLFGTSGVVSKFTAGPARPFLDRDAHGWRQRTWFGISFPYLTEFVEFINDGAQAVQEIQPEYKVTISTLPTTVNPGASDEPYASMLKLECGSAQQSLDNFNYAESQLFTWKPDECGTTTLTILFSEVALSRTYEGRLGFAKFLKEFREGVVTYTAEDFSDQKATLAGLGVQTIKVGFGFKDAKPAIDMLTIHPISVPDTITDCWLR